MSRSSDNQHQINSSSSRSNALFGNQNEESHVLLKINELRTKQIELQEKINRMEKDVITHDAMNDSREQMNLVQSFVTFMNSIDEFSGEKMKLFRAFLEQVRSDVYNWKSLAHSIYHVEYLINNLDNYQIKETVKQSFRVLFNEFIVFMKNLITLQMKSPKQPSDESESSVMNETFASTKPQLIFPQDNTQNLKNQISNLKELIITNKQQVHICQTDSNALQTILQAIDAINFDHINFDQHDQDQIHLLTLKQDLAQKSTKTDLMQFKIYIDNQVKKLIELNKQNAKELERIQRIKTSTCEARHTQTILSNNLSVSRNKPNRMYSYQSSRPYITFELDHIRQYQRQALLKSPYGTIPLYRRQAWAAANLFPNHPLHLLRHMQNSLRMQIHHLLGYDPSNNICNINKKKNRTKSTNIELFNTSRDISIVGDNNKLYRGQIDSCEIIPLKPTKEKKTKVKTTIDDNNDNMKINLDQINQPVGDAHLFEYLDWQTQLNEQDLPDELCEQLFHHWQSILCEDQPCICNSESKLEENNPDNSEIDSLPANDIDEDRCICSDCSCDCKKCSNTDQSTYLHSQYSLECFNNLQNDNPDILEYSDHDVSLNNQTDPLINEVAPTDQISIVGSVDDNDREEIIISDCFLNRMDQWTRQFDLSHDVQDTIAQFQSSIPVVLTNSIDLDDPTRFRQQILAHHRQREQPN